MSDVTFEPGCTFTPTVTVCGPGGVTIRRRGKCWGQCAKPDARLLDREPNSAYYGTDTACECGDRWNENLCERPFRRGWRKAAQERFAAAWADALPEGTRAIYDDAWLAGVRLPDGTEVRR